MNYIHEPILIPDEERKFPTHPKKIHDQAKHSECDRGECPEKFVLVNPNSAAQVEVFRLDADNNPKPKVIPSKKVADDTI